MDELKKSIESHNLAQKLQVETLGKGLDTSKLTKKIITDKNGKKTTKWVKSDKSQPKKSPSAKELEGSINKLHKQINSGDLPTNKEGEYNDKLHELRAEYEKVTGHKFEE